VFDDIFSGLDSETQKHVFDHIFGANGLLRSQDVTMLLATHAGMLINVICPPLR
jgi:Fe-S cluster assembly ATPase SufC